MNAALIAKQLASNEISKRSQTFKKLLKKYKFLNFSKDDYEKIWEGLFFYMWHCDKPKLQAATSKNLATLAEKKFNADQEKILSWFEAFLKILSKHWDSIDKNRLNKYLQLLTDMVKEMYIFLAKDSKNAAGVKDLNKIIDRLLVKNHNVPRGLLINYIELSFEVCDQIEKFNKKLVIHLPFLKLMATTEQKIIASTVDSKLIEFLQKCKKIIVLKKYNEVLMKLAKKKTIQQKNRENLYKTAGEIKKLLESLESEEDLENAEVAEDESSLLQKHFLNDDTIETEIKHKKNKKNKKKTKVNSNDQELTPTELESNLQMFLDFFDLKNGDINKWNKNGGMEIEVPDEEWEDVSDDEEVPIPNFENMTMEELKKRLPPYYFKTPRQKKKFFQDLNTKYLQKYSDQKNTKQVSKIKFRKANQIVEFNLNHKVCNDKEKLKINKQKPAKSILKKSKNAEEKKIQKTKKNNRMSIFFQVSNKVGNFFTF